MAIVLQARFRIVTCSGMEVMTGVFPSSFSVSPWRLGLLLKAGLVWEARTLMLAVSLTLAIWGPLGLVIAEGVWVTLGESA